MKLLIAGALFVASALATTSNTVSYTAPLELPRIVVAVVTAYTSDPAETWGDGTITASGGHVHKGTLACPRAIPFGTKVDIDGRTYTCEDRLAPKYDNRFDIWMESKESAYAWGRRHVKVAIHTTPHDLAINK